MTVRRCLSALVIATTAAACAATAADAKTKVVITGGPPPKASQAGGVNFPAALDLNGFFRKVVTIHVGDSVKWKFSKRVVHTVTFLAPGTSRPALETQDPAHPYSGFNDSTGAPMWFNGQPGITIPPDHAFPQGGGTMGAKAFHNSGLSAPAKFAPYTLKFTKKGSYKYICLVHPGMSGRVKVLPKSAHIPSAKADRKARVKEYRKAVKQGKRLGKQLKPKGNNVVAGNDSGKVAWFRFFPATRTIKAGQAVHFSIASKSEIHTMTFGPQPSDQLVLATPQAAGPPLLQFNPFMFLPSDVPPLPPYTGSNHGNGFFNTGIMDTNPASPPPASVDVTFTNPGTYLYECTIHPGMQATIKVE